MKQLVVISGKGGTGKTTVTASFVALAGQAVAVDADVDAADLHLLLHPTVLESGEYSGGSKAEIDGERCTHCDECRPACRFDAIGVDHRIDPVACEGCGLCARLCPVEAIEMRPALSGHWFRSETRFGPFIHAKLGVAAENSGKLVSLIRTKATEVAQAAGKGLILIDGSPGVGCPVIASLTGCDLALAVTEPTLSGLSDLSRVAELAGHFQIPLAVAINKADLNEAMAAGIEIFCEQKKLKVLARIPFDPAVVKSIAAGETLVEYSTGAAALSLRQLWERTRLELESLGT
ncbi:MAG: (4Fe-4S)-binding protein [Myxococcales bacterium]|nr:MAG: (4Fe-4S)-binding protein [Myxococcales bacterium]